MRPIEMKRDRAGFHPLIVIVVIVIVLVVALFGAFRLISFLRPETVEICGSTTEGAEREWFEMVLDTLDPGIREVVDLTDQLLRTALQAQDSLSDIALLAKSGGRDVSIGRGYLYEFGFRYFVAVGLYVGCSLVNQTAQGYQKEVQGDTVKLAVLLALAIAAPGALSFFVSIEFFIDLIFGSLEYMPQNPSIAFGPQPQGMDRSSMPDSVGNGLAKKSDEYFAIG